MVRAKMERRGEQKKQGRGGKKREEEKTQEGQRKEGKTRAMVPA